MNQFKHLTIFFTLLVLTFGLISCSSDNNSPATGTSGWGIDEPTLSRKSLNPIKISLVQSQSNLLSTNDVLTFNPHDVSRGGVQLATKTDCTDATGKLYSHQIKSPLKNQFYIYEFLSPQILLLDQEKDLAKFSCRFDFTVIHNSGSTHRFRMPPFQLEFLNPIQPITISGPILSPSYLQEIIFTLDIEKLYQYRLPRNSTPTSRYLFLCSTKKALLHNTANGISMSEIEFEQSSAAKPANNAQELCRIFELENNQHIIKMSSQFILGHPSSNLVITEYTPSQEISNGLYTPNRKHDQKILILRNNSTKNMKLTLPNNLGLKTGVLIYITRSVGEFKKPHLAQYFELPLAVVYGGRSVKKIAEYTEITIPPQDQASITFQFTPPVYRCADRYGVGGIMTHIIETKPTLIYENDTLNTKNQVEYVSSVWPLGLKGQKYWPALPNLGETLDFDRSMRIIEELKNNVPAVQQVVENMCTH